ncbi:MAG: PqqD family protein [Actinobacteria bacterium]|nr:PqqD family protein [Actinomycetota bacterium]
MIVNDKIVAREIQGETVLLNKETGDYFSLNTVGTEIFNCICKGMEIEVIVDFLLDKYDVEYDTFKQDVVSLVSELSEKKIILNNKHYKPEK